MSVIAEAVVERVVAAVSEGMSDPRYGQVRIGEFVEAHPEAAQYLATVIGRRVGAEAVMFAVFHASVLAECVRDAAGGGRAVTFVTLDAVASEPLAELAESQPALHGYVAANVEDERAHEPLARVALALVSSVSDEEAR